MQRGSKRQVTEERANQRPQDRRSSAAPARVSAEAPQTRPLPRITPANDVEPAMARRRPKAVRRGSGLLGAVLGFAAAFLSVLAGGLLLASQWPRRAPVADLVTPLPPQPVAIASADDAPIAGEVYIFRMEPDSLELPPSEPLAVTVTSAPAPVAHADDTAANRIVEAAPTVPTPPVVLPAPVAATAEPTAVTEPVVTEPPPIERTVLPVPRLGAASAVANAARTSGAVDDLATIAPIGRWHPASAAVVESARAAAAVMTARAVPVTTATLALPASPMPASDAPAVSERHAVPGDTATMPDPPLPEPRAAAGKDAKKLASPRRAKSKPPAKRVAARKQVAPGAVAPVAEPAEKRRER